MPKLTQVLGPYIKYPKNQKYYKKLSWEKEVMNYFIDNLPKFDYFRMNFHYSITNWLPFYWNGFNQTTRYTYVVENNLTIEELSKNFETDIRRRRRRKAEKLKVKVYKSNDLKKFYELNKMTFKRQGLNIPYSYEFIKTIYNNANQNIKIFFAEYDNKVIAASFLIFDKTSVYYLMGGIHPDYKDLGGMDLIQYESIKCALNNKLKFDFEGSMIESIEKYFRSFGAIQKPYFQLTKTNSKILKIKDYIRDILK
jgi:lipid II:glycine glycyltransferase (peptidoglycan interpeptide bridge formation enzyme)